MTGKTLQAWVRTAGDETELKRTDEQIRDSYALPGAVRSTVSGDQYWSHRQWRHIRRWHTVLLYCKLVVVLIAVKIGTIPHNHSLCWKMRRPLTFLARVAVRWPRVLRCECRTLNIDSMRSGEFGQVTAKWDTALVV